MHAHHNRPRSATLLSESILVCSDSRVPLTGPELRGLASEDRTATAVCASGTRHTATWTGVSVLDPFVDIDLDDETTHLLIESADGYRVCVDVYAILDTAVAYARDGTSIDEEHDYEARFIAPDVDGSQTVKGARAVGAFTLDPVTDPESPEDIFKKP